MKKNFMIIAVAVLLVGALAFVGGSPLFACGKKSAATTASADGSCASKANAQTASADGSCASKANVQTASAKSADCAATCASKASTMTASASGCGSKANASNASAKGICDKSSGSCSGKSATAANASFASTKECPQSKEACVNWLMANKDMTKVQAEAAYEHCAKSKAAAQAGVELATSDKTAETKTESESSTSPAGSSN